MGGNLKGRRVEPPYAVWSRNGHRELTGGGSMISTKRTPKKGEKHETDCGSKKNTVPHRTPRHLEGEAEEKIH